VLNQKVLKVNALKLLMSLTSKWIDRRVL